jgi:hypothetical protein
MSAALLDPVRQAAQALRDLADVTAPCVKLRCLTADVLFKVPVAHPLRMPIDQVYGWAEQIQRGRPTVPTSTELDAWAALLDASSTSTTPGAPPCPSSK